MDGVGRPLSEQARQALRHGMLLRINPPGLVALAMLEACLVKVVTSDPQPLAAVQVANLGSTFPCALCPTLQKLNIMISLALVIAR